MTRNGKASIRGVTLMEIMVALTIATVVCGLGIYHFRDTTGESETIAADVTVSDLNKCVASRSFSGGYFAPGADVLTVVTSLQADVDAKSKRAGFGNHQKLDAEFVMKPYAGDDGVPRIVMGYNAKGLPQFAVTTSGSGYVAVRQPGRTVAAEDWTARVDAAGQVGARRSAWVYDYQAAGSIASSTATASSGTGGAPVGSSGALSIEGPDTITSPGAYEWTALSTQPAGITITVPGAGSATDELTSRLVSPPLSFASSTLDTILVVTITASSGAETASKTVTVNIPGTPTVSFVSGPGITGTSSISLLQGYPDWVASSSKPGSPLVIQLLKPTAASLAASIRANEARVNGAKDVSLSVPDRLIPGLYGTLTLTATVTTANGSATTSRNVAVDIPTAPVFSVSVR